ncbi:MAG: DNA polymerase III subunit gamma/tau [Betaproteobacteria bacterium]|nr:DNA polymerase III subunit gamma/tau [Betaproteobacteria bacterium]
MAHQVLARKWRPRNFADVVGQEHVVRALANALETGRIHHAYLFTGTRGVGKTTLARILAKALNCVGQDGAGGMTSTPCGKCKACTDIDSGRFVDLLEVDAATNTKVDEMRELLETAQYAPVSGRYKVYIIDEVHMLSKSAFNAMLKTLEEPPGHVEFILATTDPQKLPITVLSRCLQFNLKNLPPQLIASHLSSILNAEQIKFEGAALDLLGRAAEGSVRDSLSLLDQAIAYGAGEVKADQVAAMLGALDQGYLFSLLESVADRDAKRLVGEIDQLAARSISFDMTLKDLASVLSRVALAQNVTERVGDGPDAPKVQSLAGKLKPAQVQLYYQIALLGRRDLALAPDEQSGFTMTMLRMLAFADGEVGAIQATGAVEHKAAAPTAATYSAAPPAARVIEKAAAAPMTTRTVAENYVEAISPVDGKKSGFDGDWPAFVAQLSLGGMAGMLAKQCEFQAFSNGVLELVVAASQKHLAEKAYQEKLRSELMPHLGASLRLNIRIGEIQGASLAAHEDRARTKQQADAEAAIEQDPFIKNLRQDFGAEVLRESIRPAGVQ